MKKKDDGFDKALDEAFDAIVLGRFEDATAAIDRFTEKVTKRIDQEVTRTRSATDSVESVQLSERDSIAFAEALINPPEPSDELREAADRYNERKGDL